MKKSSKKSVLRCVLCYVATLLLVIALSACNTTRVIPAVEPPAAPTPVVEPSTTPEPIVEPSTTPEPIVEPPAPVVEPPVVEPTPEPPVVEPPAPIVEPTPEPVVEPTPEPVVEPTPEPVVEPPTTPEPVVEPPAPIVEPTPTPEPPVVEPPVVEPPVVEPPTPEPPVVVEPPAPTPNPIAHPVPTQNPALFPYPNAFVGDNEAEQLVGNLLINPSFVDNTGWTNCATPESATIASGKLNLKPGVCFFQNVEIQVGQIGQDFSLTCRGSMEEPTYSVFIISMLDENFQTLATSTQPINTTNRQWRLKLAAPENTKFVTAGFYTETAASYDYCTLTDALTTPVPAPLVPETVFAPAKQLELLLPIYIDPAFSITPWNQAITNAAIIPTTIVVNPVEGIEGCQAESFKNTLTRVQDANIDTVGYIATGYTARDIALVKADIDKIVNCEGLDGVFFDEVRAGTAEEETYYQDICSYAKTVFTSPERNSPAKLIINPGTNVSLPFTNDFCNVNMLYENFTNTWQDFAVFGYEGTATDPATAVMLHTAEDIPAMQRVVDLAYSRKLDYIYVTNTTLPNPWTELASYYTEFLEYIALKNSTIN